MLPPQAKHLLQAHPHQRPLSATHSALHVVSKHSALQDICIQILRVSALPKISSVPRDISFRKITAHAFRSNHNSPHRKHPTTPHKHRSRRAGVDQQVPRREETLEAPPVRAPQASRVHRVTRARLEPCITRAPPAHSKSINSAKAGAMWVVPTV